MRIPGFLVDGGRGFLFDGRGSGNRHYECRECGTNLPPGAEECPECRGGVAVYAL